MENWGRCRWGEGEKILDGREAGVKCRGGKVGMSWLGLEFVEIRELVDMTGIGFKKKDSS